ncbi:MAG: DUF349 domain-containing protein, partial [Undibacterium sp.]|nr:DUF349 domain-containing protein [Undibacterium sp.]
QALHSKAYLLQVRNAMKKQDKRVAKLMQTRLDRIAEQEQALVAAQACLTQADKLLAQEAILISQIIELDKQFSECGELSSDLSAQFGDRRLRLTQRLETQNNLQRELLELIKEMDAVTDHGQVNLTTQLIQWDHLLVQCAQHPSAVSLPKNVLLEARQKWQGLNANFHADKHASKHSQLSSQSSIQQADPALNENLNVPHQSEVVAPTDPYVPVTPTESQTTPRLSKEQIETALQELEAALEQGSIQQARQHEKTLRNIDPKHTPKSNQSNQPNQSELSSEQRERLISARKELGNLSSWAKWSGQVSRDELVSTAEALAGLSLSPRELVGTVTALRQQWKQMEATNGGANKDLWERFDAACSTAYAPAAQYFQAQSAQRRTHVDQAMALLEQFQQRSSELLAGPTEQMDWKALQQAILQMQQTWKTKGQLDRKDARSIEERFTQLLDGLRIPLAQRHSEEVALREQIIATVAQLDASQKSALDQLRAQQERWQERAKALPLPRQVEQTLWERFRVACDALFLQKKQNSESAQLQREDNLKAKVALCEHLETAQVESELELRSLLSQSDSEWLAIGAVPRAEEVQIEHRFISAQTSLKNNLNKIEEEKRRANAQHFLHRIALCQKADHYLASGAAEESTSLDLETQWNALESNKPNISVKRRFDTAIKALRSGGDQQSQYQALLQENLSKFDDAILHIEILAGIESPFELADIRLKKQIEVLQSSLKQGRDQKQTSSLMLGLISMPVALDAGRQQRLDKLLTATAALSLY